MQYIKELTDAQVDVVRNDQIDLEDINAYDKIVFSPGPGLPEQAGIMIEAIKEYAPTKNILGVCLGHQAIGQAFGSKLKNLKKVYHGVKTPIEIIDKKDPLFREISPVTEVGRYHSWVIDEKALSEDLEITAKTGDGQIMAIKHKSFNVWGVQFHPESIMTDEGKQMIKNFLEI